MDKDKKCIFINRNNICIVKKTDRIIDNYFTNNKFNLKICIIFVILVINIELCI